jgi:hypothetical protein
MVLQNCNADLHVFCKYAKGFQCGECGNKKSQEIVLITENLIHKRDVIPHKEKDCTRS